MFHNKEILLMSIVIHQNKNNENSCPLWITFIFECVSRDDMCVCIINTSALLYKLIITIICIYGIYMWIKSKFVSNAPYVPSAVPIVATPVVTPVVRASPVAAPVVTPVVRASAVATPVAAPVAIVALFPYNSNMRTVNPQRVWSDGRGGCNMEF